MSTSISVQVLKKTNSYPSLHVQSSPSFGTVTGHGMISLSLICHRWAPKGTITHSRQSDNGCGRQKNQGVAISKLSSNYFWIATEMSPYCVSVSRLHKIALPELQNIPDFFLLSLQVHHRSIIKIYHIPIAKQEHFSRHWGGEKWNFDSSSATNLRWNQLSAHYFSHSVSVFTKRPNF